MISLHHQVGYDKIGNELERLFQAFLAIGGIGNAVAAGKLRAYIGGYIALVLNDEQAAPVIFSLAVGKRGFFFGQERSIGLRCRGYPPPGFVVYRHADMENGASAHSAFRCYSPLHGIHDLLHEGKSHARADVTRVPFALIERLEDVGERLAVHAFARIFHIY